MMGRRVANLSERLDRLSIPEPMSGCSLWTGCISYKGYGVVFVDGKSTPAHRAAYTAQFGEIPNGMMVCHRCDVRCCINPGHLFLGTNADNMSDMSLKGRSRCRRGSAHGMSKLSDEQALEIRRLRLAGVHCRVLARRFGVTPTMVSRIGRGTAWSHLNEGVLA